MRKEKGNNNVYIMSMEASDIWQHMHRGNYVKREYKGTLSDSLLLRKLKTHEKFETFNSNRYGQNDLSNAIINVKFTRMVMSGERIIKDKQKKIDKIDKAINDPKEGDNVDELKEQKKEVEQSIQKLLGRINEGEKSAWKGLSKKRLRADLYKDGFTIRTEDKKGNVWINEYKLFQRSSSKSRKGECMFILESLHKDMENWSRMGLPLIEGMKIDLPSLSSYEALTGSTITDVITDIKPENILLVGEEVSSFTETCDVIYKKKETIGDKEVEHLDCEKVEKHHIKNEIWDGQSLMDISLFGENQSFKQLRNHFFKTASFSCDIQKFYKKYAKDKGIDYDSWFRKDIYGNDIKMSKVKLIINKSCLKIFKFAHVMDGKDQFEKEKNIYKLWKQAVRNDGCVFGVCKHDKPSKYESNKNGNVHVTSYQMLNSLYADYTGMKELSQQTLDYIKALQDDDDKFITYIKMNKNKINANDMFVELYEHNPEFAKTKLFRDFKSKTINKLKDKVKKGKAMLNGDYTTVVSNPYEYLLKSVGVDTNNESRTLMPGQIHTKLFGEDGYNKEYVAFRSPHGSMANTLLLENVKNELIDTYFNFGENIVVISSIKHNWMEKANGADMDGDTLLLFNSDKLKELVKKTYDDYKVVVANVESDPQKYQLTMEDAAKIDNRLADSQGQIGEVTNIGMLALSVYHHKLSKGISAESDEMVRLHKIVKIMGVLAGLSIDSAKRKYAINVDKEIRYYRNQTGLITEEKKDETGVVKKHPQFWRYVSKSDSLEHVKYKCAMDQLIDVIDKEVGRLGRITITPMKDLLVKKDYQKASRKQRGELEKMACKMQCDIKMVYAQNKGELEDNEDLYNELKQIIEFYEGKFAKRKIKEDTMYMLLKHIDNPDKKGGKGSKKVENGYVRLMNAIYKSENNKETFLNAFKI